MNSQMDCAIPPPLHLVQVNRHFIKYMPSKGGVHKVCVTECQKI